jgi:hypothetical protein
MKVLLGVIALVVVAVTYPWLWWEDRHVRRRVRAYKREIAASSGEPINRRPSSAGGMSSGAPA